MEKKFYGDFSIMGSGKSLSALALIAKLGKKAMIVCPPYLVNNWLHEIKRHTHLTGSPHFVNFDKNSNVTVVPYSKIGQAEDVFKNVEIIIADEAQYLKNLESKRTKDFHTLFYKYTPEYFGYLSGTPIKNRIPEIYSMLVLWSKGPNSPKILEHYKSMYTFCCRFTHLKQSPFGTKFEGMKNVEELRRFINPFSIRHSDDILNLPELTDSYSVVSYQNNAQLQKDWDKYINEGTAISSRAKNEAACAKAEYTAMLASDLVTEEVGPIIIFSDHVKPLEKMELSLSNLRVKKITGEVPSSERQKYVDMLNKGQLDVLLCSIGAASTGFNLTASNVLIFNDPSWVPSDMEQAKKRIHRIGTTKPCKIIYVVGSSTDEYIYNMIKGKSKVINKVIKER